MFTRVALALMLSVTPALAETTCELHDGIVGEIAMAGFNEFGEVPVLTEFTGAQATAFEALLAADTNTPDLAEIAQSADHVQILVEAKSPYAFIIFTGPDCFVRVAAADKNSLHAILGKFKQGST